MLTSSARLQIQSHFTSLMERERQRNLHKSTTPMQIVWKNCFSVIKYANLWYSCGRRRRYCLSSLILTIKREQKSHISQEEIWGDYPSEIMRDSHG